MHPSDATDGPFSRNLAEGPPQGLKPRTKGISILDHGDFARAHFFKEHRDGQTSALSGRAQIHVPFLTRHGAAAAELRYQCHRQ
jgi:hypothetical protein